MRRGGLQRNESPPLPPWEGDPIGDFSAMTPAQFTKAVTHWLLPRKPDGSIDSSRATAARLQGLIMALWPLATKAARAAEDLPDDVVGRGQLQADASAMFARLTSMQRITDVYIARGDFDHHTGRLFFCVTAPLLLGWEPNADCTDVDPDQKVPHLSWVAEPLRIMNQAKELGAFVDSQDFSKFAEFALDQAVQYAKDAKESVQKIYDKTKSILEEVVQRQVRTTAIAIGLLGLGAIAYFSLRKK